MQERAFSYSDGQPASFEQEPLEDGAILRVRGEVDLTSAEAFRKALDAAIERTGKVILELTACKYMDSTGLQVVARAYKQHPSLVVVVPKGPVRRLFDITGLTAQLCVRESADETLD